MASVSGRSLIQSLVRTGQDGTVPDQLPGRLQRFHTMQNDDAGAVNCIRLFGSANLRCPLFVLPLPVHLRLPNLTDSLTTSHAA
jgi:hypothetical protein